MPERLCPTSTDDLVAALQGCAEDEASIETGGSFTKRQFGGSCVETRRRLTTRGLDRLLAYEPADLTISAEAGMRVAELNRILAENNQFLPLDSAFGEKATIGGVLASNLSGPRRRRYGTARDMTIGMSFATLDGRVVRSGGMVVKNVTGLDMTKLMIGSFGTLAVIASANFKVFPCPGSSATFGFRSAKIGPLLSVRDSILRGLLQPVAIDWLDPMGSAVAGLGHSHVLLVEASGNAASTRRFQDAFQDLAANFGVGFDMLDDDAWEGVRECGPRWLEANPEGALIRTGTVHSRLGALLELVNSAGCGAAMRAGNAAGQVLAPDAEAAGMALFLLRDGGYKATLEAGSNALKANFPAWDVGGSVLEVMQRIKADFDPLQLLNRGRLFGTI